MATRLATDIFDFYPDSPNYDQMYREAARDESLGRISDENNKLIIDLAKLEADISAMNMATRISNMDAASSDGLRDDLIEGGVSAFAGVMDAGADAGWFKNKSIIPPVRGTNPSQPFFEAPFPGLG